MKGHHHIWTAVKLLAIGVLTNFAVCTACGFASGLAMGNTLAMNRLDIDDGVTMSERHSFGKSIRSITPSTGGYCCGGSGPFSQDWLRDIQWWDELSVGWPCESFYGLSATTNDWKRKSYGVLWSSGSIVPNATNTIGAFVVTVPAWRGLIANSLLFAILWSPALLIPRLRRKGRFTAGLCPQCGYEMKHRWGTGCPECGWNR